MFWRMGFSTPSAVDSLLSKETCTLEDLFDEEEIIQECRALNNRLVNFLRNKEQVQQMLCYIVEEPPEDAESKRCFRFPFIACEIFCCEIDAILKTLVENEELMNLLFSFLEPDRAHQTLLAGYFSKVVISLLLRKTIATMRYIQAHQGILGKLINLIGVTSIMEVLIRLVGADDHMYTYNIDPLQWLADTNLLEMLIDALSLPNSPEVHANSAETLCAIARLAPSALSSKLSSPSFLGRLFHNALENLQSKSTLVHSLSVCITLLDPKRALTMVVGGATRGNHISEPVMTANPEIVDGMLQRLGKLLELLNVSSDANVLLTTYGELRPPLGMHRLKIVEFISVFLRNGNDLARQEIVRLGAIQTVIKLFFDYPFNNALHHYVESGISSCLESNSSVLIDYLFQDCDLLGKLLEADVPLIIADNDKPTVSAHGRTPPRAGNLGHITRIANRICDVAKNNIHIETHLQANPNWIMWQMTTLQSRNNVENVLQWACGRPSTIQERTLDSDEDEFRDRDYDVPGMANSLPEGFHNGMFESEGVREDPGNIDKDDEDVFFEDESPEVVSSLCLAEQDSAQLKESIFTSSHWFSFQDEGSKESTPVFPVSSTIRMDDSQVNIMTTSGDSSGSDDEVVVGEDEELIDTAISSASSFVTAFDTELCNGLPQTKKTVEDLSSELEKVGISDNSSFVQCEENNMDILSASGAHWVGWREFEEAEGTSGRNQASDNDPSEVAMGNVVQTGSGSTLPPTPSDLGSAIEMDTEPVKELAVEGSSVVHKEGPEAEEFRGRMGLSLFVENVEFVGVEV